MSGSSILDIFRQNHTYRYGGGECMISVIEERVLEEAQYIENTHETIRKTAEIYGVSKSTVHHDIAVKLKKINYRLYVSTRKVLQENFDEKHIRGGIATKKRYINDANSADHGNNPSQARYVN